MEMGFLALITVNQIFNSHIELLFRQQYGLVFSRDFELYSQFFFAHLQVVLTLSFFFFWTNKDYVENIYKKKLIYSGHN